MELEEIHFSTWPNSPIVSLSHRGRAILEAMEAFMTPGKREKWKNSFPQNPKKKKKNETMK